jgi:hypothetical protein
MSYDRFTCTREADESLAGMPASIIGVSRETKLAILEFDDGSRLEVATGQLRLIDQPGR